METTRTEQIHLGYDPRISELCHLSKNLFNQANYIVRQEMFATGRWVGFREVREALKSSPNFIVLPAQTAQETIRALDACWYAYFMAFEDWRVHPEKYLAMPRYPKYKKKDGEYVLFFTSQQVKLKKGKFTILPRWLGLEVGTRIPDGTRIRGARIIPRGVGYTLEIIYDKQVKEAPDWLKRGSKPSRALGIDLGVDNLLATTNNIGTPPLVFRGGPVKSMNQYFNKRRAELQGVYARQGIDTGPRMQRLSLKRNRKINYFFHVISKLVILYCQIWEIDTIVIGRSKHWKQDVALGAVNNQNFVFIPFYKLVNMIRYKAEELGIRVIESDEAYTSLCSFLDWETIEKHETYLGKRIKRGLFRSAKGVLINSDLNGAYNHMRNAIPESMDELRKLVMEDGIEAVRIHPVRAALC